MKSVADILSFSADNIAGVSDGEVLDIMCQCEDKIKALTEVIVEGAKQNRKLQYLEPTYKDIGELAKLKEALVKRLAGEK